LIKTFHISVILFLILKFSSSLVSGQTKETVELTANEQAWLNKYNGVIKLAHDPNFAPYEFLHNNNDYKGIGPDYIQLLENKTGIRLQLVNLQDWGMILNAARSKEIDILAVAASTEMRREFLNFTKPYLTTRAVIITRTSVDKELSIDDLKGMRVTLVNDYVWDEYVSRDYPDLEIDRVTDPLVGMRKVSFGMSDAMILGLSQASYYIEEEGFANLKVVGVTNYTADFSIGVRKDWPELISILNKGIDQISQQEREIINERWYFHASKGIYFTKRTRTIMVLISVFILLVLVSTLLFNKRLNAKVKEKTHELQNEHNQLIDVNKELIEARDKATESERLTKAFLTNISHEVRTPMNSIIGFAQLLELDEAAKRDRIRYASLMIKGGQQLLSILDSIIHLAKMESGVVKPVDDEIDIYLLIRETYELMLPMADGAGLQLKLRIDDDSSSKMIKMDRLLLQQVLNNLVSNAIKYTPDGEVILTASCQTKDLKFSVTDTGVGIDEGDKESIFKPFRQVKHRTQIASGAGLGLATAKRIVEVLQGRIWHEANNPKGSVFHVEIPINAID
jgi:signal transduction histidine kinase